jgi:SAM-dependent methyltransferase
MTAAVDLNACCAVSYGHPLVRWLLGDSLHPGGLALTSGLAHLMGIEPSSSVLDAGSGVGASTVHLAQTLGCRVTGVTLEAEGVTAGYELARRHGVEDRVRFVRGDVRDVELPDASFDYILMECVLSILAGKAATLRRLYGLLRPGGRLGLSDVTVSGPLPPPLLGVLATVGCVGGALSLAEYRIVLGDAGFAVEHSEDCEAVASSFMRDIGGKLLMAEVACKLGKLHIVEGVLAEGERLLASVNEQVRSGVLGYGMVVARKSS